MSAPASNPRATTGGPAWLRSLTEKLQPALDKVQPAIRNGATGVAAAASHAAKLYKLHVDEATTTAHPPVEAAPSVVVPAPAPPPVAEAALPAAVTAASTGGSAASTTFAFLVMLTLIVGTLLLSRYETLMELVGGPVRSPAAAAPAATPAPAGTETTAPPMMMEQTFAAMPAGRATHADLGATRRPPATARTMMMEQSYVEVSGAEADFELVSKPPK